MSVEVAVFGVEEATVISDFLVKHFKKDWHDIIICGEHPFPTDDDFKKEDPK